MYIQASAKSPLHRAITAVALTLFGVWDGGIRDSEFEGASKANSEALIACRDAIADPDYGLSDEMVSAVLMLGFVEVCSSLSTC